MQATSKGSDQTARMRRLIWGFAGRAYHIVGNLMHWLKCADQTEIALVYAFVFHMQQKNKLAYDQETPHSHTADQPTASWGKATEH